MPRDRALPRPTRLEWAGLVVGVLLMVLGGIMRDGIGTVAFFAGTAVVSVPAYKVRNRRLDAIRARPPW